MILLAPTSLPAPVLPTASPPTSSLTTSTISKSGSGPTTAPDQTKAVKSVHVVVDLTVAQPVSEGKNTTAVEPKVQGFLPARLDLKRKSSSNTSNVSTDTASLIVLKSPKGKSETDAKSR